MVKELKDSTAYTEIVKRQKLVVVGIADKRRAEVWNELMQILRRLELEARPSIEALAAHYENVLEMLQGHEIAIAKRTILIKLYCDGDCVFAQEGLLNTVEGSLTALKHGIKEALKTKSVNIKFVRH